VPAAAAGLAVAFTIGNTSGAPVADEMTGHSATTTGHQATTITSSSSPLVSITPQAGTGLPIVRVDSAKIAAIQTKGKHHRAQSAKYVVRSGDTLASIAKRVYASADYWPVLYWANHAKIPYANQIQAGLALTVPNKPAKIPSAPQDLAAAAPAATTASSGPGYSSASSAGPSAPTQTASTYSGSSGSFQACVIARESGGNSQVMNGSGHYGLYQFSASTWAAYGGNPADFGHASAAEQNQVFANAMAAGGQSNWAPYDGC
jgi:LysM repeat protein